MAKPMLYRLGSGTDTEWLHVTRGSKTAKVRRFLPEFREDVFTLPADSSRLEKALSQGHSHTLGQIAAMTGDALDFEADSVSWRDKGRWCQIVRRLLELDPTAQTTSVPVRTSSAQTSRQRSPIPQTRLRRFYQTLRMLNCTEVQGTIVQYLCKCDSLADRLQEVFAESVRHFSCYRNDDERFHDRDKDAADWFVDGLEHRAFAKSLVARLQPVADQWHSVLQGYEVKAIDYEISPFRTTGRACFEDGKVGTSGAGGLDLLLVARDGSVPVVGEIKARTDKNLFLALMQALTYAVELTTPAQVMRLRKAYTPEFDGLRCDDLGCQCDLLLLYEDVDPKLLSQTKSLVKRILRPGTPIGKRVRRISLVRATLTNGCGVRFSGASWPQSLETSDSSV